MTIESPLPVQLAGLRSVWQQAFGDGDAFLDGFFRTGFSPDRCRCITEDGVPVAALYWFDCHWQEKKLAYLYAVATEKAHQGQGLCRTLMADTHAHLQSLGYAGAVLVPGSPELFALYGKMGYTAFCPMETRTVNPIPQRLSLQPCTAPAYAEYRKAQLSPDSIWQAGETLDFLATFCAFYIGKDFAFCGAFENNTFYFQEFLGNSAQLPGILSSLGAKKGVVRLPGGTTPFAMYRSLDGSAVLPAYFGIPLN